MTTSLPPLDDVVGWVEGLLDSEQAARLLAFDAPGSSAKRRMVESIEQRIAPASGVQLDLRDSTISAGSERDDARQRLVRRTLLQVVRRRSTMHGAVDLAYVSAPTQISAITYFERWYLVGAATGPLLVRRDLSSPRAHGPDVVWQLFDGRSVGRLGAVVDARQLIPPDLPYERADFDEIGRQAERARAREQRRRG